MIFSRMWPYSIVSNIILHNNFNSCCKEGHLKSNRETVIYFLCIFYRGTKFTSHQYDAATLLKKIFEGVWDSNFKQSEQVKFAKFPTIVVPHRSVNSWNQWISLWWFNHHCFECFRIIKCTWSKDGWLTPLRHPF